jgi:tRNA-dihydrouridine synthase 4
VQTAIHAGASYIGVHGRTRHQKDTEPANWEGIKFAREETKGAIPVVGNGDIFTLQDSIRMKEETGVNAAMSARGLLENPVRQFCHQAVVISY